MEPTDRSLYTAQTGNATADAARTARGDHRPMATEIRLSNYLTELADQAGRAWQRHRTHRVAAATAYIDAGHALAEAKRECRHGEWLAVLERAGIPARTARNMRAIAESGLNAEAITEQGGIRASLEWMRSQRKIAAIGGTPQGTDRDPPSEPATSTDSEAPQGPATQAPAQAAPGPTAQAQTPQGALQDARASGSASIAPARAHAAPARAGSNGEENQAPHPHAAGQARTAGTDRASYHQRRAMGLCVDCPAHSGARVRCEACTKRLAERRRRHKQDAAVGRALAERILNAARERRGLALSATEVAKLVGTTQQRKSPKPRPDGASAHEKAHGEEAEPRQRTPGAQPLTGA